MDIARSFSKIVQLGTGDQRAWTPAERLALAVLLFHAAGPWDQGKADAWFALTGRAKSGWGIR
jgi:hypothetical protein